MNYVAWIRWRKEVGAPITETDGRKRRHLETEKTVESGDEIYTLSAKNDEDAVAQSKEYVKNPGGRGGPDSRRLLKLWKVKEIEIPQ